MTDQPIIGGREPVGVRVTAGVGRKPQRCAHHKAFRLHDLSSAIAVLLHLEESFLDQILSVIAGPAFAHENIAQAAEAVREAVHAHKMPQLVAPSTVCIPIADDAIRAAQLPQLLQ